MLIEESARPGRRHLAEVCAYGTGCLRASPNAAEVECGMQVRGCASRRASSAGATAQGCRHGEERVRQRERIRGCCAPSNSRAQYVGELVSIQFNSKKPEGKPTPTGPDEGTRDEGQRGPDTKQRAPPRRRPRTSAQSNHKQEAGASASSEGFPRPEAEHYLGALNYV